MLFFKKLSPILSLVLHLALAVNIAVTRDTSTVNYIDADEDTVYLWSAVATFKQQVTDGQLVALAEDGFKSMLQNALDNVSPQRMPLVMTALVHKESDNEWTVYLASSTKGTQSLVYQVTKSMETFSNPRCGQVWDTVPASLQKALQTCSEETNTPQHLFDAQCGEMNALLMIYARTNQDPRSIAAQSTIVTWQGSYDEETGEYVEGRVKRACRADYEFGCNDTLWALTEDIRVLDSRTQRETYKDVNEPVAVTTQPIFPGYTTEELQAQEEQE